MTGGRQAPERLLDLGAGLAIWRVHVDDLHEQPLNAQSMPPAMFARLKATIERDGRLEQLPFGALVCPDPVRIELVGGHHRTRAARAAETFYIHVLVDETGLTPDQIKAKQLAHNAISGDSEAQLVARIFEQIGDVDARLEAYVEPPQSQLAPVRLPRLDVDLAYTVVMLVFLRHQEQAFAAAVDQLADDGALAKDPDVLYLADMELAQRWRKATARVGREYDARAITVQVSRLVDLAMAQLGADPGDLDPDEWVPLPEILGSALVPPGAAKTIGEAVEAMTRAGKARPKRGWEAVLELAAAYLDGHLRP